MEYDRQEGTRDALYAAVNNLTTEEEYIAISPLVKYLDGATCISMIASIVRELSFRVQQTNEMLSNAVARADENEQRADQLQEGENFRVKQVSHMLSKFEEQKARIAELEALLIERNATIEFQKNNIDLLNGDMQYAASELNRVRDILNKRDAELANAQDMISSMNDIGVKQDAIITEREQTIAELRERLSEYEKPKKKTITRECPSCNGTGKIKDVTGEMICPGCGGNKRVSPQVWKALGGKNKPAKRKSILDVKPHNGAAQVY